LSGVRERVYPVGRLDLESEGLLLLTNDGELAHLLTHPRYHVPRVYRVWVEGVPSDEVLQAFHRGIPLEDGVTAPAQAKLVDKTASSAVLEITLYEGKKRQVRRMCAALGHPVRRLVRIAIGPLTLGHLPPGRWRSLTPEEVSALYAAANLVKGETFVLE
ncbi:MAG: pseudouridine synthase, partial [Bacillota bacterium]|nr:pseudouridine synthase [Bacillota bacterium]